jgi:hypothetical protein
MIQAGLYSATMHYLKAIEAAGSDGAPKVMEQMRATPVNDFFAHGGKIRIDDHGLLREELVPQKSGLPQFLLHRAPDL